MIAAFATACGAAGLAAALLLTDHTQDPRGGAATPPSTTTPLAPGLAYADATTVQAPHDFLRGFPTRPADGLVNAVVEIPAGATDKWEVKLDGVMRWDLKDGAPRRVAYLGYPTNYGIVPRAVLGLGPALPRGTVVGVRVLGAIRLVENGERDDKLVCAPVDSPFAGCTSIEDLDRRFPGVTSILRTWFENYKGAGALQCSGYLGLGPTHELVDAAAASFAAAEARQGTPK
jgi:inorganic pyrophosphatase